MAGPAPWPDRRDSWPTAPAGIASALEVIHRLLTLAPPALVAFVAWSPPLVGCLGLSSVVHAALSPALSTPVHAALVLVAACFSATPLEFLSYGAIVHGDPLQRALACAGALALGSDFHLGPPWCEVLTLAATLGLSPAMGAAPVPVRTAALAVLVVRSGTSPAFPASPGDDVCPTCHTARHRCICWRAAGARHAATVPNRRAS